MPSKQRVAGPGRTGYRHHGVGLVRAAADFADVPGWPDPADAAECRSWLAASWGSPGLAAAIRYASPVLSGRVAAILADPAASARDVRRVTLAVVRYVLRARGRSTPFGTFAGVAPVAVGAATEVRWGDEHRPVARADSRWLHQVVLRLEDEPDLLARLPVVANDTARVSAGRWELPGQSRVSVRATPAVLFVRELAAAPVPFAVLADKVAHAFPATTPEPAAEAVADMLVSLVRQGFLLSSLRAPSTVTDPVEHVLARLHEAGAVALPIAPLLAELEAIQHGIAVHNHAPSEPARIALAARMRTVAGSVREPLSVDLRLDAHVRIPTVVATEMQRAADVLARLVRQPTGSRAWREWFSAFVERYGTGTLVPLALVLDPDSGLGLPRGYPGSPELPPGHVLTPRDEHLLAIAHQAVARGEREVDLDDGAVARLASLCYSGTDGVPTAPPHVDLGARIHATSPAALDRGEFTFTVAPGRAAGTLTSRFATLLPETGLTELLAAIPAGTGGAVPVQLSFPPIFPNAENICRVPKHLPDILAVGEHRTTNTISVDDLALTAGRNRLHLVSLSHRQVLEPQVLHALAAKQQPPLARLLGEVTRALGPGWIGFDWGAGDCLPFLPRLRHRRAILSPARWRVTLDDVQAAEAAGWDDALRQWQATWRCPSRVQLRDFDQHLPLDLTVAAHRAVLYRHLRRHDSAVLLEAVDPDADGWLGGHPHSVVLPLSSRRPPEPAPAVVTMPVLTVEHGHLPAAAEAEWLYAKVFCSPQRIDHLIVHAVPALLEALGDRDWWFVRYPRLRPGEEPSQLRLRIRTHGDEPGDVAAVLTAVSAWATRLRTDGLAGRLAWDTYYPEIGRYLAMREAEAVFAADSRLVQAQLTHPTGDAPSIVVTALSLFDIATAFLRSRAEAAAWLCGRGSATTRDAVADHADTVRITRLARGHRQAELPHWQQAAAEHAARDEAVARYRQALPAGLGATGLDGVLRSLLHMHHNRALGVDRDREAVCLRLARHSAAAWASAQEQR